MANGNIATFGVVIDPSQAKRGSNEVIISLRSIGREGKKMQRKLGGGFDKLRSSMRRAFAAVGFILLTKQAISLADAYTNVQNRLKLVTKGTDDLAKVTSELFLISNRTRSSFTATAELYSRMALSAEHLGRSQNEILDLTESINKAIILSGAAPEEAAGALRQLSQGLAANRLSGQELNSVLEQTPLIAKIIANELGVATGKLRIMGEQGKITADVVFEAFRKAKTYLDDSFGKTIPTIGQSFQVLKNQVINFIGDFDKATGISRTFSRIIFLIAENIDKLRKTLNEVDSPMSKFMDMIGDMNQSMNDMIGFLELGEVGKAMHVLGLELQRNLIIFAKMVTGLVTKMGITVVSIVGGGIAAAIETGIVDGIGRGMDAGLDKLTSVLLNADFDFLKKMGVGLAFAVQEQRDNADQNTESFGDRFNQSRKGIADHMRKTLTPDDTAKFFDAGIENVTEKMAMLRAELEKLQDEEALRKMRDQVVELEKVTVEAHRSIFDKLSVGWDNFVDGFGEGFQKAIDEMDIGLNKAASLGESVAGTLTDSFQSFFEEFGVSINSFSDAMDGLKKMAASVADAVIKELIRIYIVEQLVSSISSAIGGIGGGGGAVGNTANAVSGSFKGAGSTDLFGSIGNGLAAHTGGVVGQDYLKPRSISRMALAGAQMYHGGGIAGLKNNEVPTILEKGEGVFTKGQMRALGNQSQATNVEIQIVNIVQPVDVISELKSRAGQKQIINTISNNPESTNNASSS